MTATLDSPAAKTGNGEHFRKTLEAISKVRPRYPIDTWKPEDAVDFWLPGYDFSKANPLPPLLILGVAARMFARSLWVAPALSPLLQILRRKHRQMAFGKYGQPDAPLAGDFCRLMHLAYRPVTGSTGDRLESFGVGEYRDLLTGCSYCHRKTCINQRSFLGGCICESAYNELDRHNQWVPWSSVQWGGVATWLVPLRYSTDAPYVSVQKSRSHVLRNVVYRDMANRIELLHREIPPLLLQLRNFPAFVRRIATHVESLEGERLRFLGMKASSPDCDDAMRMWDEAFTASAWCFGRVDRVYYDRSAATFCLPDDKYAMICDNQPDDLFPVIPETKTP